MADLFDKYKDLGPLGKYQQYGYGYYFFPKLVGEIGPHMQFNGKTVLNWSLNNYLGLANHPEVRKADTEGTAQFGLAAPMGARMMSGQTSYHEELERKLAASVNKESAYLLNFGYPGMISIIDCLVNRNDVIVYDSEAHACIMDALRMVLAKRFVYQHNDIDGLKKHLARASKLAEKQGGGVLVITEGVFGMAGDLGKLDEICALKKEFNFRLLVDDAHGYGTMGKTGGGTGEHFGVQDQIDVYFSTFAKAMAGIGGFVASSKEVINFMQFNMRSQVYAKSLPMPMVMGLMKRLELCQKDNSLREKLWTIVNALQKGLVENGFDIGKSQSPVTPVYFKNAGVENASQMTVDLRENYNIFCSIVIYPIVPKDVVMLRIIPTAAHTLEDVDRTIKAFKEVKIKLDKGVYKKEIVTAKV